MTHASVFSGIGGPEVAATMLGWDNLFHCEINPFGRAVLDYWYPNAKSYDDITKTDFSEWRGKIDVLTGGFPCQPFSYAGQRRGAEDDRYLWPYMFKCIDAIRPTWVVAENVAGILTMVEQGEVSEVGVQGSLFGEDDAVRRYQLRETFTLERICDDLETHGYAVQPVLVPACAVGAPHRRDRVFIVGRRRDSEMDADERRNVTNATSNGGGGNTTSASGTVTRQNGQPNEQPAIGSGLRDAEPTPADTPCGGEGAPGEGGSVEGNGSNQDKQPCQRRAASEWNSRFYELLRNAQDPVCGGQLCGRYEEQGHQRDERNAGAGSGERICHGASGTEDGYAADTDRQLRWEQSGEFRLCESEQGQLGGGDSEGGSVAGCGRWRNFPTVSPVHRGNDGLPFPLDDLTISPAKWRTEALKAYGNAIVPQVMYEIFRAIQLTEEQFKFNK